MTKSLGSSDQAALVLAGLGLAGSPLPCSLAKLIRKQASVREAGVLQSHPARCLEADLWLEAGQRSSQERSLLPCPCPSCGSLNSLDFSDLLPFPRERRGLCRLQSRLWNYLAFLSTFILKHPWEKCFFKKKKRPKEVSSSLQGARGRQEVNNNIILLENCKQNIWKWK